jgi:beta-galactosidase
MLSLFAWMMSAPALAEPHHVVVHEDEQGFTLRIDGKDTMLFGMNWDYLPVGQNYRYQFFEKPDAFVEAALRKEMGLLSQMGVNAIRQYPGIPPRWVEWIYDNYGIYTLINPLVGRYGTTVGGQYVPQTPYGDPAVREQLINETLEVVKPYVNTRGVVGYLLGNESNYGLEWTSFEIAALPKEERQRAKAEALYSLFGEIIDRIHEVDEHHPVAIANGDLQYLDLIAKLAPNMDILAANVYRGRSSGDLFERVKKELGVPFYYSEFGSDAYNARDGKEDGQMQASFLRDQWEELYLESYGKGRSGVSIGGFIFQWADGWWKHQQEINLDIHDNTATWPNGGYPDFVEGGNNMNEEWFGIAAKTPPEPSGLYDVQPRAAYWLMKDAFELDPYSAEATPERIRAHFEALRPEGYEVQYDVAKVVSQVKAQRARISDLRFDFGTFTSGGSEAFGRGPANLTFDHVESVYLGAEAQPVDALRFDTSVNVLGNIPQNRIDGIFFENRGDRSGEASEVIEGFNLSGLERIKIYRASLDWKTKNFDVNGFYRVGHYHWAYEGDVFGLYPETNYGPAIDIYNADVPIGVAVTGKEALDGLKIVFGPQVYWGANPAVFAKYTRPFGRYSFSIVHQEDIAPRPISETAQSQAVPEQLTRKTGVHLGYARGESLKVDLGGLWAGTPKLGQEFSYQVEAKDEPSYNGSGFHVLNDEIRMIDTFGGKAKISARAGKVGAYVQGAYKGLVADGGGDYAVTLTGWTLKESGRGNQTSALAGAVLQLGSLQIAPNALWQRPLIGPNSPLADSYDPITRVYYPGLRARNFVDDPFAVLDNRETIAGELMLVFDPTPATWFFMWDNEAQENAAFAGSLDFVYRHQPTTRDASFGFTEDGALFAFPGAPPAQDVWEVNTRMIANLPQEVQLVITGYVGTAQSRGIDERVVFRKGGGVRAYWRSMVLDTWVKVDDWGPYDFHRDFNLTFPLQVYADLSAGLMRRPLVGNTTRISAYVKHRFLDEFSPDLGLGVDDPWGNEFEIGTFVRMSL